DRLAAADFVYPCFCSRKEIQAEIARSASAPQGPEGALYPGTCRSLGTTERAARIAEGRPYALRLNVAAALASTDRLTWQDLDKGLIRAEPRLLGDVVLGRR